MSTRVLPSALNNTSTSRNANGERKHLQVFTLAGELPPPHQQLDRKRQLTTLKPFQIYDNLNLTVSLWPLQRVCLEIKMSHILHLLFSKAA